MRDYWSRYHRKTYAIVTAIHCLFVVVFFGALELLGVTQVGWGMVLAIAIVAAAILNALTVALLHVLGKPFRDLVQAVVLASG